MRVCGGRGKLKAVEARVECSLSGTVKRLLSSRNVICAKANA
jgi:hypothetical protein